MAKAKRWCVWGLNDHTGKYFLVATFEDNPALSAEQMAEDFNPPDDFTEEFPEFTWKPEGINPLLGE